MNSNMPAIFNIIRGSYHDGTGMRTVVYFKGCNLRCKWCHNPEGQVSNIQIMHFAHKCISCGRCIATCKLGCYSANHNQAAETNNNNDSPAQIVFNRLNCKNCNSCVDNCPSGAIVASGEFITAKELVKIIMQDKAYYDSSNGGVTFSGGECLLNPDYLCDVLTQCKVLGINTAIESAFNVSETVVRKVSPLVDLIFADIKCVNSIKHKELTGAENKTILRNIKMLSFSHSNLIIRMPLIPSLTDTYHDLSDAAEFINGCGEGIKSIEFMKYNDLFFDKYAALGVQCSLSKEVSPQVETTLKSMADYLAAHLTRKIEIKLPL